MKQPSRLAQNIDLICKMMVYIFRKVQDPLRNKFCSHEDRRDLNKKKERNFWGTPSHSVLGRESQCIRNFMTLSTCSCIANE